MRYYDMSSDEVLRSLSSAYGGLSSKEAALRLKKYGENRLPRAKRAGVIKRFFASLADPMIIMLLCSAAISTVTSVIRKEPFTDLFIILFVVIVNTVLGMIQESKAEHSIEALSEMTAATTRVLRDGKAVTLKSELIVPGDVILLEAGDAVPADCRVIESHSLKAEESALTGESVAVTKCTAALMLKKSSEIALGDRENMVYCGSTVVLGRGRAVVTACGSDTEMGKIAEALTLTHSDETPLQKKMAELSKILTKIVIAICLFIFVYGTLRSGSLDTEVALDTFLVAVALAVAAIPEGLPAVVTIILSIGVGSMSKRRALVRKLTAVETLGCTSVICTDKTGTLTQNKMRVEEVFAKSPHLLARAMTLCCDATRNESTGAIEGDPTECALVEYAFSTGEDKDVLEKSMPRVGEIPFESERKMMTTVHRTPHGYVQYTKGACDILLPRCNRILRDDGSSAPITARDRAEIERKVGEFAKKAYRVLGAAYRELRSKPSRFESSELERDMIFVGFVGMADPCRPGVKESVEECRMAGIRTVMITGDHRDTAIAVGEKLGIIRSENEVLTGDDLDRIGDKELQNSIARYSVYARVKPEHKTRIVKAWKARGAVTAMTGDGVNDAPSIKAADIGIGMGISGTDVTKSVSDMVLADDNFSTIVGAVEEGRKIYDNIRKVLEFQISTNLCEIIAVFFSSAVGISVLTPAHLLWINMVTDSAPGLALGTEKAESDLMSRAPRHSNESVFADGAGADIVLDGLCMGLLVIGSFFLGQYFDVGTWGAFPSSVGTSMAFLTTNFIEVFHAFNMRSRRKSIFSLKYKNPWLYGALAATAVLTLGVMYLPWISGIFGFEAPRPIESLCAVGIAAAIIPLTEIRKLIKRIFEKKHD